MSGHRSGFKVGTRQAFPAMHVVTLARPWYFGMTERAARGLLGACINCGYAVFAAETKVWDGRAWWHAECWPPWLTPLDPPGSLRA